MKGKKVSPPPPPPPPPPPLTSSSHLLHHILLLLDLLDLHLLHLHPQVCQQLARARAEVVALKTGQQEVDQPS